MRVLPVAVRRLTRPYAGTNSTPGAGTSSAPVIEKVLRWSPRNGKPATRIAITTPRNAKPSGGGRKEGEAGNEAELRKSVQQGAREAGREAVQEGGRPGGRQCRR